MKSLKFENFEEKVPSFIVRRLFEQTNKNSAIRVGLELGANILISLSNGKSSDIENPDTDYIALGNFYNRDVYLDPTLEKDEALVGTKEEFKREHRKKKINKINLKT